MIPLKDLNPSRTYPVVCVMIIAANIAVFIFQLTLGEYGDGFVMMLGAIPYKISHNVNLRPETPFPVWLTIFTAMFMHGGFLHLGGNMLYLWIFGDNVEDVLGHFRFLLFYLLTGAIAAITHITLNVNSVVPMVGASGAIAGVLGAYFIFFPKARILTVVPIFIFLQFVTIPAVIFLGLWFLLQVLYSGFGGNVAWYAHMGGFVAGALLALLMGAKRRRLGRSRF